MHNRPLIGVAVIVIKNGNVLLGKRKNAHGDGTWAFPGGHLEFNESIKDCARREIFEETGIRIKNLRYGPYTNDIFDREGKHYVPKVYQSAAWLISHLFHHLWNPACFSKTHSRSLIFQGG